MEQGFLNPQQILKSIPLKEDMTACDFGSGSGGWTIPLALELKNGIVYAVDVLEEAVSALSGKATAQKIFNIKAVIGDVEKKTNFKDDYFDLVLVTNLLFQVANKKFVLEEARRILKPNGIALIIDWKSNAPIASKEIIISLEEVTALAAISGFKKEKEIPAGYFHWGLLIRK